MASEKTTDYERKRLENIKRNRDMVASLKIHSHISDLSSSSKRIREEKSYKQNSEKKSKPKTPIVIRRSLRIQELPPDSDGLPNDCNDLPVNSSKSNTLKSSKMPTPHTLPLPLEDLSLELTYEGRGSHLALPKKLCRITRKIKSDDENDHFSSPTNFVEVKPEEFVEPCSVKLESDGVVCAVKPEEPVELCSVKLESDSVASAVKLEDPVEPCSMKLESDNVAHFVPRRSTRKKKLNDQVDHSDSREKLEGVKVEDGDDPHLSKFEFDDIPYAMPRRSTRKTESDGENGHLNSPTKFERAKVEEPIDPRLLKLEDDNIARVVPGRISSIRFFPTAEMTMVVVGNKYGYLGFWDVKPQNGEEEDVIHLYKPHSAPISGISVNPFTLSKVYTGCYDGILRLLNVEREKFELVYSSADDTGLYSLTQQPNDANSLYFGEGRGLNMFDVRTGNISSSWLLHENRINSIDFSPTNTYMMATGSIDGFACIWDIRNMSVKIKDKHRGHKALCTVKHARSVHSAYFSPSGSCLATTSLDDNIGVLCGVNFENTLMIPHDNWTNRWVSCFRAVWGWDDTHLFIGNMKRRVDVLSVTHKRTVHTLESSNMSAIPCRYHAHPCNVGMLAGATSGGQVYIWTASS